MRLSKIDLKKTFFILLALWVVLIILFLALTYESSPKIDSFEECAEAGYPIMESYPRQCRANGETFVENITIGGEKDEHGCLVAGGYSWNMTTETCVRQWEIEERDYVETNVDKCEQIQFLCASPKTPFLDSSGCGCELEGTTQSDFK